MILENGIQLYIPKKEIASKDMDVFYNPVMSYQRDITISFLNAYFSKDIRVALPLAGSGVRGVRIMKECSVDHIFFNDRNPAAVKLIHKHIDKNDVDKEKCTVTQLDANEFLGKAVYDYVDIDPYGSSIYFVAAAVQRIVHNGVLAVTNTDTAALCGTYPSVTKRRYGAKSHNSEARQELGVRILIKKVQEIAAMYDIGVFPVLSMAKDHYMRVFFIVKRGKKQADKAISEHSYLSVSDFCGFSISTDSTGVGPLYVGQLQDAALLDAMSMSDKTFLKVKDDAILDSIEYFYDVHDICQRLKRDVPKYDTLFSLIQEKGYNIYRTHFYKTAIKTNCPEEELIEIINKIKKK